MKQVIVPWLELPALDNFAHLKVACLESKPIICEGHECTNMQKVINTTEGSTI